MRSSCPSWGKWAFVLVVLLSEAFQTLCIHQQKTFFRQALAGHLIFVLQLEKFGPEERHGSWTQSRKPATKTWDPTEHDKNCSPVSFLLGQRSHSGRGKSQQWV